MVVRKRSRVRTSPFRPVQRMRKGPARTYLQPDQKISDLAGEAGQKSEPSSRGSGAPRMSRRGSAGGLHGMNRAERKTAETRDDQNRPECFFSAITNGYPLADRGVVS